MYIYIKLTIEKKRYVSNETKNKLLKIYICRILTKGNVIKKKLFFDHLRRQMLKKNVFSKRNIVRKRNALSFKEINFSLLFNISRFKMKIDH